MHKTCTYLYTSVWSLYDHILLHTSYTGEGVILDRSVFSDSVFANVCKKEGYISPEGQHRFSEMYTRVKLDQVVNSSGTFENSRPDRNTGH